MKIFATLFIATFSISCFAQSSESFPYYSNSVALEFFSPASYFVTLFDSHQPTYKVIELPAFFLTYEGRIKNKFYLEGALSLGHIINETTTAILLESYPYKTSFCISIYSGIVFKQKIFKNFYFTPSIDFYYSLFRNSYNIDQYEYTNYITLGPTIGFEYFISKRISLNTDLLNINCGLQFYQENEYSNPSLTYFQQHDYINIYKYLSLGIHYNFNWKKAQK